MLATSVTQTTAVRLTGVRKSFGPVRAVDGIDLHLAEGAVFAGGAAVLFRRDTQRT